VGKAGFDDDKLIEIDSIEYDDHISTPPLPPAGQVKVYAKNGKVYRVDSSGEEVNLEDTGAESIIGRSYLYHFGLLGNANNKWLVAGGSGDSSDGVPAIAPFSFDVLAVAYSNKTADSDIDLEFYINGIDPGDLVYTESIVSKKSFYRSQNTPIFTLTIGDELSVFASKITPGTAPISPTLDLVLRVNAATTGTGGS
jgi:hypothetical protein